MFGWFRSKRKQGMPPRHEILAEICTLVMSIVLNPELLRSAASRNCSICLDDEGGISLRWLTDSKDTKIKDLVGFAPITYLKSFKNLVEDCAREAKNGTFDEAYMGSVGQILIMHVALEAYDLIQNPSKIAGQ